MSTTRRLVPTFDRRTVILALASLALGAAALGPLPAAAKKVRSSTSTSGASTGTTGTAAVTVTNPKIATDLQAVLSAAQTPSINYAKDVNGARYVKVLIVSNADDAELTGLRSAVMAAGGSIYYRYSSVQALAAMLPANKVSTIAARADVQSISPNRLMARTASTIESVTGTAAIRSTGHARTTRRSPA